MRAESMNEANQRDYRVKGKADAVVRGIAELLDDEAAGSRLGDETTAVLLGVKDRLEQISQHIVAVWD